jgi:hypothetical protein
MKCSKGWRWAGAALDPLFTLTEARQDPVLVSGARLSSTYFDVLGVAPALGRSFLPEEQDPGGIPVTISGSLLAWKASAISMPVLHPSGSSIAENDH